MLPSRPRSSVLVMLRATRPGVGAISRTTIAPSLRAALPRGRLPQTRCVSILSRARGWYQSRAAANLDPSFTQFRRRQRMLRFSNALTAALLIWLALAVYNEVVFTKLFALLDALEESHDNGHHTQADEDEEEEEDYGLFLPFPLWKELVAEPEYKGSDPEWQTFVKISRDSKQRQEIQEKLVKRLTLILERHPSIVAALGSRPYRVRRMWLEFVYPRRPAAQYYVPGFLLYENGIAWAERITPTPGALDAVFEPRATASAAWTFISIVTIQSTRLLLVYLGLSSPSSNRPSPLPNTPLAGATNSVRGVGTLPSGGQLPKSLHYDPAAAHIAKDSPTALLPARLAMAAAYSDYLRHRKPKVKPASRGCLFVKGMISVEGKKARMNVVVNAAYNPATKDFEGTNLQVILINEFKQYPAK